MKVSRVREMRAMDQAAITQFGISDELLMENAGHAAYFAMRSEFTIQDQRFLVFCGVGNNGGDGLVLARKIHANEGRVRVILMDDPTKYQGPAKMNYEIASRLPIEISTRDNPKQVEKAIDRCDVIVDAIFGTGLSREVKGVYLQTIEQINASRKSVLSIDIPSGVHGDTGRVMGTAVRAHLTVTFGLPKLGNLLSPGYELGGKLFVSHISFPPSLHQSESLKIETNQPFETPDLVVPTHKESSGKVLIIAGSPDHNKEISDAARAFMQIGGGQVLLAVPTSTASQIPTHSDEITVIPQEETEAGRISTAAVDTLIQLAETTDMVILGSGMSDPSEPQSLPQMLITEIPHPLLISGDSTVPFLANPKILHKRTGPTILATNHREIAKAMSTSLREIEDDQVDSLQKMSAVLNTPTILKGARCLFGLPDQHILINMTGSSGMAAAGLWDSLPGTIAAMCASGLSLDEAAGRAIFVHGLAGDLAAVDIQQNDITMEDILARLPSAVQACRQGLTEIPPDQRAKYAGGICI
jgi:hydroxyethylthiazole kinase-like uncharacterized protein yjeF